MTDLILSHITKSYGDRPVLRDFSARFPASRCTCIMGPSGCGKTTLLRLILGLEPLDGGTIQGRSFPMSAVFQENRLFEDFSALTNAALVCPRAQRQEAARHLTALGLKDSLSLPVRALSGGMKRRVAIARAVLAPGELIILDEPFTGLDQGTKAIVLDYLKAHTQGRTLLLVTHAPEERDALAHEVLTMTPLEANE
ncbi:MAG TPA: ATP-binding cassette domain-containing protein [Candidatus Evtepia faecigallinarum]|nr:ATP-binding cassette domain-containing protein [Candidatus Evtepia faecigallinarum]